MRSKVGVTKFALLVAGCSGPIFILEGDIKVKIIVTVLTAIEFTALGIILERYPSD